MESDADIDACWRIYQAYHGDFKMRQQMTRQEFHHYLRPIKDVLCSFVVERNGTVVAYCSYYLLPNLVANNPKHTVINSAFMWYYGVEKVGGVDVVPLLALVNDLLTHASNTGVDVVNTMACANATQFVEQCKFAPGDGTLHFYLYNWRCKDVVAEQ